MTHEIFGLNENMKAVTRRFSMIPMCVQSYTIEVRNAHLNGVRLNAHWYETSSNYNESAAQDSWERVLAFFEEHLVAKESGNRF